MSTDYIVKDINLAEFAMEELHRSAVLVTFTLLPAPPA